MIKFCEAARTGREETYIGEAIQTRQLAGDGAFTRHCSAWFMDHSDSAAALLTPSCTHALEMSAVLLDIQPGDEVIMPSYTFVSTANAYVLRGAKIVFVDVKSADLNIDETLIEAAITPKTKVIVPVHYAGVPCEMDIIMDIANRHSVAVVEDAAQGLMSFYKGKPLGTIGTFGCLSFHTTKNFTSGGEGGLLYVNDPKYAHRAEVFREKGTNRSAFFRGEVDKYTWRDIGSSMLPSELQMAYLWAQLEGIDDLHDQRMAVWQRYFDELNPLDLRTSAPELDPQSKHNGHIFYLIAEGGNTDAIQKFKNEGIGATSHYEPLHSSVMGREHGRVSGPMDATDYLSQRLVRLPVYASLGAEDQTHIIDVTKKIFL